MADEKRLKIQVGDYIVFDNTYRRKVVSIRRYETFERMLDSEQIERIMPGKTKEEILAGLRNIYSPEKESLGVLVFGLGTTVCVQGAT